MALSAEEFFKIEMRVATVVEVLEFPEARKPAYVLLLDIGEPEYRKSTAQLTYHYSKEELRGKQVIAVCNLEPRQVGPHLSQCLVLGAMDNHNEPILLQPEKFVQPGSKIA